MRRLTWLDETGVRHRVSTQRPGCICGAAPTDMTNIHDEIVYTGVDEGDHVVNCVTCMAGEEVDADADLLEMLRKSTQRFPNAQVKEMAEMMADPPKPTEALTRAFRRRRNS